MNFSLLPAEVRPVAQALIRYAKKKKAKVYFEKTPWPDAPYRTTLVIQFPGCPVLVEAQGKVEWHSVFNDFVRWAFSKRHSTEIFIATTHSSDISGKNLQKMKEEGVGLLIVQENGTVAEQIRAANPALIASYEPTVKLGPVKKEVDEAIHKFNRENRKDGLKDMCEVVERETEALLVIAIKKAHINLPSDSVARKNFSEQIDTLASANALHPGKRPLFDDNLKHDMHSFRGARNLVHRKVMGQSEELRRQRQYLEKMVTGPRLIHELLALKRKLG